MRAEQRALLQEDGDEDGAADQEGERGALGAIAWLRDWLTPRLSEHVGSVGVGGRELPGGGS